MTFKAVRLNQGEEPILREGNSQLRILIITHMYPTQQDPTAGIFIHQHVQALKKERISFRLISPIPWSPRVLWLNPKWKRYGCIPGHEVFEGISIRRVPYIELPLTLYRPYAGISMALSLRHVLMKIRNEYPFNVIHCHTITPDGLASIYLGKYFNVPTICSIRGSDLNIYPFSSSQYYKVTMKVLKKSSAVICVSEKLASDVAELTDGMVIPKVIYNGVDSGLFFPLERKDIIRKELSLPLNRRMLCYVGRIETDKGIRELYKAFLLVASRFDDVDLICVGDGSWMQHLREKILRDNLVDRIFLPKKVPHDQVAKYMQASDIFILPSYSEGMPNSLLEAMACGLTCIVSDVGGIPEVIVHKVNGLLVQAHNSKQLITCLFRVLKNNDLAIGLSKMAYKTVSENFSWIRNASEHAIFYKDTLLNYKVENGKN